MSPRHALLATILVAGVAAPLAGPAANADAPPQVPCIAPGLCPDLWADAATMEPFLQTRTFSPHDCNVAEGSTQAGTRKLLRFTFTTPNKGPGDLLVGRPQDHDEWFEWGACHGHYHFKLYAEYRLWTPSEFARWDQLRNDNPDMSADDVLAANPDLAYVTSQKQGFCVIDIRYYSLGLAKYYSCNFQGISAGWADEYYAGLDGQFVDVTDVPSGTYILEEEVNAHRLYEEADYNNNRAWVEVTI